MIAINENFSILPDTRNQEWELSAIGIERAVFSPETYCQNTESAMMGG